MLVDKADVYRVSAIPSEVDFVRDGHLALASCAYSTGVRRRVSRVAGVRLPIPKVWLVFRTMFNTKPRPTKPWGLVNVCIVHIW